MLVKGYSFRLLDRVNAVQKITWISLSVLLILFGFLSGADAEELQKERVESIASNASLKQHTAYFDILEYQIVGNTLLSRHELAQAVYPYLGYHKSINDIEAARKNLGQLYREKGYPTVLVGIPEQEVLNGIVRLRVTEGRVGRLRVSGSRYFSLQRIREQLPSLAKGKIPYLPAAQHEIVALNKETTDRTVIPVFRPGLTPGTVEVELKVKDHMPLHGTIELNNRSTDSTTELRASTSLRYDNLWQREHSLSLQYQTSPQNTSEVKVLSGTYLMRFSSSDKLLVIYGVKSDSETATVGALDVIGKGDIIGLRGIIPLGPLDGYTHNISLGLDYKDFDESIVLQGADRINTPINYFVISLKYSGNHPIGHGNYQIGASINLGVRGLGNGDQEFDNKRFNARPDFIYLRVNGSFLQEIFAGIDLSIRTEGQLANSPLISNEQFSAGGAESVRGYHETQSLGDDAIQGSVEIYSPPLNRGLLSKHIQHMKLLAFLDGAALRIKDSLPGQDNKFYLSSTGIGLRLTILKNMNVSLDWALPLKEEGSVGRYEGRTHFKIDYSF